jgi:hypothetical protein
VLAHRLKIVLAFGGLLACAGGGQARAAADDVGVGGYHDEVLRAAHRDLVSDGTAGSGAIEITVDAGGPSVLSSNFTPRFGGYGFEGALQGNVDIGALLKRSFGEPGAEASARGLRFGQGRADLVGVEVGWSAGASFAPNVTSPAGTETFMLGGELAVSGVRVDAGIGEGTDLFGLDGQRVSAGLGYSLGPLDARVGYSLVEDETAITETSLFTLGSQLALRPGLVVQGDLAYAEREDGTPATAAGLVSLRLRF